MSYIDLIEQDLVDAARRQSSSAAHAVRRRRRPFGSFLVAGAVGLLVSASAAAGTLYVLRGEVIPGPDAQVAGPAQTPVSGSSTVLPLRAPDPKRGEPAWALRVSRSQTGLVCTTVGQDVNGDFGIVGLDGRFRELAEGRVDSCGAPSTTLAGARVYEASSPDEVRTVLSGVAGSDLRSAVATTATGDRKLDIGADGSFIAAFAGYPEDTALGIKLSFRGGRTETRSLGAAPYIVTDPEGEGAWEMDNFGLQGHSCVTLSPLREPGAGDLRHIVCGRIGYPRNTRGYYLRIFRTPDDWSGPVRTVAIGQAGPDIARVELLGDGPARTLEVWPNKGFMAVLPASVDPASLRVRITEESGKVHVHRKTAHETRAKR